MARPINSRAWAIGTDTKHGFRIRRIVWGRLLALHEKRPNETIRPISIHLIDPVDSGEG